MLLRSSAVTLWTSAHTSFLAPGGGGLHTTCQSPCWALTVPPSGAWAAADAAGKTNAAQRATAANRRAARSLVKPRADWVRTNVPFPCPGAHREPLRIAICLAHLSARTDALRLHVKRECPLPISPIIPAKLRHARP